MELYIVPVLIVISLGLLVYKGILFALYLAYPLPGEELKWRRAPTLPMQDLSRRFGSKSSKGRKNKIQTREKEPLAHIEMPMESMPLDNSSSLRPSSVESGRLEPGTDV